MTHETYSVRGNTALLDAVGMTVSAVREDAGHRYIVITNTDGHENASREWTAENVKALIERYEAKGNWTFAFFGEGLDAWADASRYGFAAGSAMAHSTANRQDMFAAKARVSNAMRRRHVDSSRSFAAATAAAMQDPALSDEEIARILEADSR